MTSSKPKIFIVDDNETFRKVMLDFLNNYNEFEIIGEAADGFECLEKINDKHVDIILMDINMPKLNGIKTTKIINQKYANSIKVIALTQHDEFEYIKNMIESGAKSYVIKTEVGKQLITAIKKVMKGEMYFPNSAK
jgi:DNA-binding NarL/FixJ family response regulator